MYRVRFNLRNKNFDSSSILLKCSVGKGKLLTYSTGASIPVKMWNDNKRRAYLKDDIALAKTVNSQLDKVERTVHEAIQEINNQGKEVNIKNLKYELDLRLGRVETEKRPSFNQYISIFIEKRIADSRFKKESIKVYKTFRKRWEEYCKGKKYEFEDLTINVLEQFIVFLCNHPEEFADNTVNKMVATSKTILNDSLEAQIHNNLAHKSKKYNHSKREADNISLSQDEIARIFSLDYTSNPRLDRIRDIFILACNTGFRYKDFDQFVIENYDQLELDNGELKPVFNVVTRKTGAEVCIPLNRMVEAIWNKYDGDLPPIPLNQKMNVALKEIGKDAGIDKAEFKTTFRNGRETQKRKLRYERISTHTGRRSFATNCIREGIPIDAIMLITGHKTVNSFMKYVNIKKEEHAKKMSEHPFFQ